MQRKTYPNNRSNYNADGFYQWAPFIERPEQKIGTKIQQDLRHRQIHSVVVWTPTSITPEEFESMPLREKVSDLRLQRQHANEQFIRTKGKSNREGEGAETEPMRFWKAQIAELDDRIANLTGQIAKGAAKATTFCQT